MVSSVTSGPPMSRARGAQARHRAAIPDTRTVTDEVEPSTSGVPLDRDLWALTRAAVDAAGAAVDAHLAGGGYRPRVALPEVGTYDSGWPRINKTNTLLAPENAPTDYAALFSTQRDVLHPFAYEDLPELAALLDFVRGSRHLRSRLTVASPTDDRELLSSM